MTNDKNSQKNAQIQVLESNPWGDGRTAMSSLTNVSPPSSSSSSLAFLGGEIQLDSSAASSSISNSTFIGIDKLVYCDERSLQDDADLDLIDVALGTLSQQVPHILVTVDETVHEADDTRENSCHFLHTFNLFNMYAHNP